jgi:opacity protein-like surface antigen
VKRIKEILAASALVVLAAPPPVNAQLIPQPWVSVGGREGDVTFSVGARAFDLGVELGRGPDGASGVDVLKFLSLPVISPYVGIGLYSEDQGIALSGGLQVNTASNLVVGVGYNSVRGVNGQVGIRF